MATVEDHAVSLHGPGGAQARVALLGATGELMMISDLCTRFNPYRLLHSSSLIYTRSRLLHR